ncbi:NAD-binding protein [Mycena indigotica]|uniref:NAD-binding protein n=1 Tax=Mycena indigotica TaxID=2126181 RepID=A0A8H6SKJ4_9AGAR|nr:NAD-binding protein [Mycena indigotica]KAF7301039.1 NAD-binding protein [Mycena indigotica]
MSISEDDLLDLHGKVALVTGGNTGIGYATIQMLARKGAKVYMAARDEGRAIEAIKKLEAENINDGSVHWLKLDLSDPRLTVGAAKELMEKEERLDIIVNNAARALPGPYQLNKDGLLDIMVTNHISHFALTQTLLPLLEETSKRDGADVRIVNVSSSAHGMVQPSSFTSLDTFNKDYGISVTNSLRTYGNSKLANVLYMKELQRRLKEKSIAITCISAHPGAIRTIGSDGFSELIPIIGGLLKRFYFKPPRMGAMTVAFAAAGAKVAEERSKYEGAYLVPIAKLATPSPSAQDQRLQRELFEATEKIIADLSS